MFLVKCVKCLFEHSNNIVAGLPLDLLQPDFWVPGVTARQDSAKFQGKTQYREIFTVSGECCLLWATRMTKDLFGNSI